MREIKGHIHLQNCPGCLAQAAKRRARYRAKRNPPKAILCKLCQLPIVKTRRDARKYHPACGLEVARRTGRASYEAQQQKLREGANHDEESSAG
jgi:hypothetical protein